MCFRGLGGFSWLKRNPRKRHEKCFGRLRWDSTHGAAPGLAPQRPAACGGGVEPRKPLLQEVSPALIDVWQHQTVACKENPLPGQSESGDPAKVVFQEVDANDPGEVLGSQAKLDRKSVV